MNRLLSFLLAVWVPVSVNAVCAATPLGARQSIGSQDLKRHIAFLASDTLEGRAAGSRGGHAAATYLAGEFRRMGLTPAGDGGDFLQEFGRGYRNVLALLPGSDPTLSRETILFGGHFDHVGYGKSTNSFGPFGQIHNGADDNASGAAAILEVAEAFTQLDQRPSRSILFALWDAEEAGMLGSEHWAEHPSRALDQVKLALNVDMVGRLRNEQVTVYGVRSAAGLRRIASLANRDSRLVLDFDWTQRKDSDHWTFCQRRIPYLMFHTGDHEDYHRPSDDVDKLNFGGLERLSRMLFDLTQSAAATNRLAGFREESLREGPAQQHEQNQENPPPPSRLGIAWSPSRKLEEPFEITRVVSDSPAEQAGLQPGDRIVRFDGRMPHEIADLIGMVLSSPGLVRIEVEREGEASPLEMQIKLRGSPVRLGVQWRTDSTEPDTMIVTAVIPGSPAAKAGIKKNDRIYRADGSDEHIADWIRTVTTTANKPLALRIERDGDVKELLVNLQPAPPEPSLQMAD